MLISEILEKTQQMSAAENMANRLADKAQSLADQPGRGQEPLGGKLF